jgi:2-polyprenyl-3-methyl-5-hydroxy-6-metoxy-1,4-benzoquinol methylase
MGADTAFTAAQYDEAYPAGSEQHFWHRARNAIVAKTLKKALIAEGLAENAAVLEVGCGPGIAVAGLRAQGLNVIGSELARPEPLPAAAAHVHLGVDAMTLPAATRDEIKALLLLDVIEHLPEPASFIRQLSASFPAAQLVIVTVPAGPEVWSNYDTHFGHYRRYTKASLSADLTGAGLHADRPRAFFFLLYLAALALKLTGKQREVRQQAPSLLPLHRLLVFYFAVEAFFLRALPFLPGLSLLAVARRGN